jgi:hypothetical protein
MPVKKASLKQKSQGLLQKLYEEHRKSHRNAQCKVCLLPHTVLHSLNTFLLDGGSIAAATMVLNREGFPITKPNIAYHKYNHLGTNAR